MAAKSKLSIKSSLKIHLRSSTYTLIKHEISIDNNYVYSVIRQADNIHVLQCWWVIINTDGGRDST